MTAPRWELLRALGALTAVPPPAGRAVSQALGLVEWAPAEHTRLFVLELPPYASIHLGPEGKLGGEGADRVAGLWRALGLVPPAGADHLACLLGLYAEIGHASETCATEAARRRLDHAREVLLCEHLASWLPGYLAAVAADPAGAGWAELTLRALREEIGRSRTGASLPVALRDAPPPIDRDVGYDDLLDALTAPLRTGFVLTYRDLTLAGQDAGAGVRRGERRYALRAMFEQRPSATLAWLADHSRRWEAVHRTQSPTGPATSGWWAARAAATGGVLTALAAGAAA